MTTQNHKNYSCNQIFLNHFKISGITKMLKQLTIPCRKSVFLYPVGTIPIYQNPISTSYLLRNSPSWQCGKRIYYFLQEIVFAKKKTNQSMFYFDPPRVKNNSLPTVASIFPFFLKKISSGIWAGMRTVRYFDGKTYEWVGVSRQPSIICKVCPHGSSASYVDEATPASPRPHPFTSRPLDVPSWR